MKKQLYISRKVENYTDVFDWYFNQGCQVQTEYPFHITILYSKNELDWGKFKPNMDTIEVQKDKRQHELFGEDKNCLVVLLDHPKLQYDHEQYKKLGAVHGYSMFNPHITISYDYSGDIGTIKPYDGNIILTKEIYEDIKTD